MSIIILNPLRSGLQRGHRELVISSENIQEAIKYATNGYDTSRPSEDFADLFCAVAQLYDLISAWHLMEVYTDDEAIRKNYDKVLSNAVMEAIPLLNTFNVVHLFWKDNI